MTFRNASLFTSATPLAGREPRRARPRRPTSCRAPRAPRPPRSRTRRPGPPRPCRRRSGAGASGSAGAADRAPGSRGRSRRRRTQRPSAAAAARRAQAASASSSIAFVSARPTCPRRTHGELDGQVVDLRRLGRAVRGEAEQQRALARDECERIGSRLAQTRARRARVRSRDADLDVPEARRRAAVRDAHQLARLALSAVEQRDQPPLGGRADRVAAPPEARGDSAVARVADEPSEPAVADLARGLALELEVEAPVVDRPGAVRLDQQPVARCPRSARRACPRCRAPGSRSSCARSAGARSPAPACSRRSARGRSPTAVSREERKPARTPSRTIGTGRPSTPSSSQR